MSVNTSNLQKYVIKYKNAKFISNTLYMSIIIFNVVI